MWRLERVGRATLYFYRGGKRVATMVIYGNVEEFIKVFTSKNSNWVLFDQDKNTYFFIPKEALK